MRHKKRVSTILLISLILFSILIMTPLAHADLIDSISQAQGTVTLSMKDHHPSNDAAQASSIGHNFTPGADYRLTSAKSWLDETGSPTGNAHMVLYSNVDGLPGVELARSEDFDVSTISGFALHTFTFTGAQQYIMLSGINYFICYENPTAGTIGLSDFISTEKDGTPSHAGFIVEFVDGVWAADAGGDDWVGWYVYGETNLYQPSITSAVITGFQDTDNIGAMKTGITYTVVVADGDGADDIENVSLRATDGADATLWQVSGSSLDGVASWDIDIGADIIDIYAGSCSWAEDGVDGTAVFAIDLEWDHTGEEDLNLAIFVEDTQPWSAGFTDMQTDYFDPITRLVTQDFGSNVSAVTVSSSISIYGDVRYTLENDTDTPSSSYPPDAAFTSVDIIDGDVRTVGTDVAIVNGYFNATVTSATSARTTTYVAFLFMTHASYTDALAPDGDIVYVSTNPAFYPSVLINQAFDYFGVGSIVTTITDFLNDAIMGNLVNAFTVMTTVTINMFKIVWRLADFLLSWIGAVTTFFLTLSSTVVSIIDGTNSVVTGIGNIWTVINFSDWGEAVPLLFFISWCLSVDNRARQMGGGWNALAWGDITIAIGIMSFVIDWSHMIISFALDLIFRFINALPFT